MRTVNHARREERRQHILKAAMRCFVKTGFHGTTTAAICAEAGMSPGNVFQYFPNKDALITGIVELERNATIDLFKELERSADIVDGFVNLTLRLMHWGADPISSGISAEVAAEATRNPIVRDLFISVDALHRQSITARLRRGIAEGLVCEHLDIEATAIWLLALIDGAIFRVSMGLSLDIRALEPSLRQTIRAALLKPAAASGLRPRDLAGIEDHSKSPGVVHARSKSVR